MSSSDSTESVFHNPAHRRRHSLDFVPPNLSVVHNPTHRRRHSIEDPPNLSDLRIILLGKNLSENIRVRNFILGTDVMETEDNLQNQSLRISGTVENRCVAFINCHLLQPNLSHYQITERVRDCVNMSTPGPHVFILVLQQSDFSKKDRDQVKHVLKEFGDQAIKRSIVLTTAKDSDRTVYIPVHSRKSLINECGGGHLHFNEGQEGWCSEMLRRVDEILKKEPEEYLKCDMNGDAKAEGSSEDSVRLEEYKSYHQDDVKPKESRKKNTFGGSLFSLEIVRSDLNVVLCGSDAGLKVTVSKLLRGKKPSHRKEFSSECVKKEVKIHGRQISVVELPSLTQLSEDEVRRQTFRCVSLCNPGVHVFVLVVPVGPLTDNDKEEMQMIQKMFYSSSDHFRVIFTTDVTVDKPLTDFVESYADCKSLINLCGGRYRLLGLKEYEKCKQTSMDYIKDITTEPYSFEMYLKSQEKRVRHESEEIYKEELSEMKGKIQELQQKINSYGIEYEQEDLKHLRIVLIGKTGSGKSATGNTILGRKQFHSKLWPNSVTTVCEKGVGDVDARSVAVVDTPGLFDTKTRKEQVLEEIVKCVSLSAPGPHAFIIVLSLVRLTQEETDTIDLIKKIFGPEVAQFSIILFTRGDELKDESIEDYVKEIESVELNKLIRDCGDRYLAFNNNETQDRSQVMKLIKMIEEMKTTNHCRYFTNSMFEEAEMSIKKKMEEILKEKEREIQNQKEEIKVKHEIELKNMKKRMEEEKRKADEERVQMENKFKEQEETLRIEFEEKEKTEQQKREKEKQKRLEEEKQQRDEYDQMIKEIEKQRSQYEKREKEKEEEDRKREEKYRQDREKMKHEQEQIIAELKKKQEEEIKKKDLDEQKSSEHEKKEKQEWARKIREAEQDKKETRKEIKRQHREWEEDKKRQMREREEDERKRRKRHEEQMREKQEELEKMIRKLEKEKEEERQKREEERQKERQEREEKEKEYEEKKNHIIKHYENLEQKRKEWERRKQEDDERREKERKRWEKRIEDIKREKEEKITRIKTERKEKEEDERKEMKKKHDKRIKEMMKKHEDEARKQAEVFNEFRERKEEHVKELKEMLEEQQKQQEVLEKLHQHLKEQKGEEVRELQEEVKKLKDNPKCSLM